jgi:tetratricopeptide (TPR) repeat protein
MATDMDIDTGTATAPAVVTPTAVAAVSTAAASPAAATVSPTASAASTTPVVSMAPTEATNPTPSEDAPGEPAILAVTPTPGEGVLKMKDLYKAGYAYYKKQDFANAIRYLKESLQIHDPYTPKFYYAEANAILGVIYEFHIIDKSTAYYYYQAALKIDPTTATAKKHVKEVKPDTDSE